MMDHRIELYNQIDLPKLIEPHVSTRLNIQIWSNDSIKINNQAKQDTNQVASLLCLTELCNWTRLGMLIGPEFTKPWRNLDEQNNQAEKQVWLVVDQVNCHVKPNK